ncbi:hypothetical protein, partial [Actinomyces johnsonii]|uniref:hypothetical protein n=1 Tax=Actinomyces johnsonii TaxID=544581 RepID=UPI0028527759
MSEYPKIAGLLARASSNLRGSNKSWLGVLFENSIVCHVFYAIWFWGAVHGLFGCVWFLGAVCFWFAWLWVLLGVG